jgi:hypothetical protein
MSQSVGSKIGHFFKINLDLIDQKEDFTRCSGINCSNHHQFITGRYCSECGSEIEKASRSKETKSDSQYDILPRELAECVERGYRGSGVWIINFSIEDVKDSDEDHECGITFLDPHVIIKEQELVRENPVVKQIVQYMNDTYGVGSIELKYGVYVYIH